MPLHFSEAELTARRDATIAELARRGLDGLLIFRQESMFYLTGYDTFGFCFFQCLYLGADGSLVLLTRAPDLRQARHTSMISDIRVWVDSADSTPEAELRTLLAEYGGEGKRLGLELDAYGLTAAVGRRLEAALAGFAELEDASDLVSRQRLVKSAAEIAYVREAARLGDLALDEAARLCRPGAFEGDILAAMQGAVFAGGGDYPGNEFIIGSGPGALLVRYFTGRRHLETGDQLTLEFAGAYRHYHACLMRTLLTGPADPRSRHMHEAAAEALDACRTALRPGRPIGEVFKAHARVLDAAGYRDHRMNACGYSLGATFAPIWMDWPMFYAGNSVEAAPGMVFFIHIILADSDNHLAMTLGETVLVTAEGNERLSTASLDLVVNS